MRERTVPLPRSTASDAKAAPKSDAKSARRATRNAARLGATRTLRRRRHGAGVGAAAPVIAHQPLVLLAQPEKPDFAILDAEIVIGEVDDLLVVGGEDEGRLQLSVDVPHQGEDSFP